MKRTVIMLMALPMLSGCSYFNVTRTVKLPSGKIYTVNCRKDDLVSFEKDGLKVVVDGRGRPGMIEQAIGIMFMSLPEVTLEK